TGPNRSSWPPSTRPSPPPPPPPACPYKTLISDLSRPGTQPIKRIPQLLFAKNAFTSPSPSEEFPWKNHFGSGGRRPHNTSIYPPFAQKKIKKKIKAKSSVAFPTYKVKR
ncbi:hypothetical protein COCCADRAFT_83827, partial [Bipolaris zeicola 26-R-13]